MGNQTHPYLHQTILNSPHPQLDNAKRVQQGRTYRLKITTCLDHKEYLRWEEKLNNYYSHMALFLPESHNFSHSNLCGSVGTAIALYPDYPHLLHTEIYHRLDHTTEFSQPELWYLLLTLLTAKRMALEAYEMLDDIRPKNVLLNAKGMVKIPLMHSWSIDLNKYQKALAKIPTYLAPQELEILKMGTVDHSQLTEPAEMFAIGLTLLSAVNLQDYQILYDYQNIKFNANKMEKALQELLLSNRYSEVLRSCILNLTALESSRRMGLFELWNTLNKHNQAINSKSHFIIDNAPPRLHQEVQILRGLINRKNAVYPSSLPDSNLSLFGDLQPSYFEKLVPSHLQEKGDSLLE